MSNNLPAKPVTPRPFLSDETYDRLKFVAQILLPGLGALYFGLAAIWGLPAPEKVVGTVTTIDVFLGLFLGLSTKVYNAQPIQFDANLEVVAHDPSLLTNLEIFTPPEELVGKSAIIVKVTPKHLKPYEGDFPEDKFA